MECWGGNGGMSFCRLSRFFPPRWFISRSPSLLASGISSSRIRQLRNASKQGNVPRRFLMGLGDKVNSTNDEKWPLWYSGKDIARLLVGAPMCVLCVLCFYGALYPAGIFLGILAAGFFRSTVWGRYLTRAITVCVAILGPGIILNPFLYGDVTHAQWKAGKPQSSVAEFIMYFLLYEIVLFVGVYLIDKSDDGVRRKYI
jgi:hypothetical protein